MKVETRGGTCIPVQCDHTSDGDIEELFRRVEREQNGRLDLLVNNAYAAVNVSLYGNCLVGHFSRRHFGPYHFGRFSSY